MQSKEYEELKYYYQNNSIPEIKTNKASEVLIDFCNAELAAWKEREETLHHSSKDIVEAIGKSTLANISKYNRMLNQLKDTLVGIYDEYLIFGKEYIQEKYGLDICEKIETLKDDPENIFIHMSVLNELYHVSSYPVQALT